MILKVLKIARAFRRVQFENVQNHEFTNCTRRSCDFFIYSTFNKITSFPWKLNRYSYRVQFGINCTAFDQSKLSNFVECTIRKIIKKARTKFVLISKCLEFKFKWKTLLALQIANCENLFQITNLKYKEIVFFRCLHAGMQEPTPMSLSPRPHVSGYF